MEFVYIIQCPQSKLIKIGRTSSHNPYQRISSIQTSNPFPLDVIRVIACEVGTEGKLHCQFSSYRFNGEWFKPECLPLVLDATNGFEEYKRSGSNSKECKKTIPRSNSKPALSESSSNTQFSFLSWLVDRMITPKFCSENPYIDSVWERKAALEGVTVEQCFNNQLNEHGHVILLEAYSSEAYSAFQDLKEYHLSVTKHLRDPITPFTVFVSAEDSEDRILWEIRKIEMLKIADSLDKLFAQVAAISDKRLQDLAALKVGI